MTLSRRILTACAAALCLGAAAVAPAAAGNIDAHQESKMMRHRPVMMPMHQRGPTMHQRRRMQHRRAMH